jgi:nucleotidyltransferase substrate binding protein (TIGR01987 family)
MPYEVIKYSLKGPGFNIASSLFLLFLKTQNCFYTHSNNKYFMKDQDIRWKQRFKNYSKALLQLNKFFIKGNELNELERQGMIKSFEYTYELAWNTIKDFYESQGEQTLQGSRDAIQLAFKRTLISNGEGWMEMLKDRNRTSHVYNEEIANEISENILNKYYLLFLDLQNKFNQIISSDGMLF